MEKRAIVLLALAALSVVAAYYFYFYEAESIFFTGSAGTLMLMASVFLTGSLLAGGRTRRGRDHEHGPAHGHVGHAHEHRHGNEGRHEGHLYENRERAAEQPPTQPPGPGKPR